MSAPGGWRRFAPVGTGARWGFLCASRAVGSPYACDWLLVLSGSSTVPVDGRRGLPRSHRRNGRVGGRTSFDNSRMRATAVPLVELAASLHGRAGEQERLLGLLDDARVGR